MNISRSFFILCFLAIDWVAVAQSTGPSLDWATYYGGDSASISGSVITDAAGNVYLAGGSTVSRFGIAYQGFQDTTALRDNNFLIKFSSAGQRLWATYYGGNSNHSAIGGEPSAAIDLYGNVYLWGYTDGSDSVAYHGFQNAYGGGLSDAYLVKFDSAGHRLWATYYGGLGADGAGSIACDKFGNVYVAGVTESPSGISAGGFQDTFGGVGDLFLAKFDSAGHRLWATYYGGSAGETNPELATDDSGNVYMSGFTSSTENLSDGGFRDYMIGVSSGFLVKFNWAGQRQWATYYGSSAGAPTFLATDATGNLYMSGYSQQAVDIAYNGFQDTIAGGDDAYLVKFNSAGQRLWATFYGGTLNDEGYGVSTDDCNNVYMSGLTLSTNNIFYNGFQSTNNGATPYGDAFIAKFDSSGQRIWGSYYGGTGKVEYTYVYADNTNNVYMSGNTTSPNGIAYNGYCDTITTYGEQLGYNAFLAKISTCHIGSGGVTIHGDSLIAPAAPSYQWYLNGSPITGATSWFYIVGKGHEGDYTVVISDTTSCGCTATLAGLNSTGIDEVAGQNISVYPNPSTGSFYFSGLPAGSSIEVFDLLDQQVYAASADGDHYTVDLTNSDKGVYLYRVTSRGHTVGQGKLVVE